jgi:hypothetical protein
MKYFQDYIQLLNNNGPILKTALNHYISFELNQQGLGHFQVALRFGVFDNITCACMHIEMVRHPVFDCSRLRGTLSLEESKPCIRQIAIIIIQPEVQVVSQLQPSN